VVEKPVIKETSENRRMSLLTSLSLSLSNLRTKKVRTLITSIAGSIGIIGIAAILALASGINLYIGDVEKDTMSAFPITLDSSGIDITSFLGGGGNPSMRTDKTGLEDNEISVINTVNAIFSQQNKNDIKSFKRYIEENSDIIDPYVNNIQYKYGIVPQIYLENESAGLSQVNPDTIFSKYGFSNANVFDMISGASNFGMKNFSELPGDISVFEDQYDVVAGTWPSKISEVVVVLLDSGSLTDKTMYTLGIKDRKVLENTFEDFSRGEDVVIENNRKERVIYDEVLESSFKLVNSAEKYVYDETYGYWVDRSEDLDYMDQVIREGLALDVVGIVKAKSQVRTPMLSSGIYYTQDLTSHLIKEAASYDIVKKQIENKEINIFTNKAFGDETDLVPDELFQLENLVTINQGMLGQAFNFDIGRVNLDFSDFQVSLDQINLPDFDFQALSGILASQINVPAEDIQNILTSLLEGFLETQNPQDILQPENLTSNFNEYITSQEVQEKLISDFEAINSNNQITQSLGEIVENYLNSYVAIAFDEIMKTIQNDFARQIESGMDSLPSEIQNAISIDSNKLTRAFQFNLDEDELFAIISGLGNRGQASQESNLEAMGYRSLDDPVQIDLYPKDFTSKDRVIEFIEDYNDQMRDTDQDNKIVKYTDLISAILSSVTTIIDTVSYALIAFVAISLLVSSIMIGVITYVSVLERIKEIGILRAIGASKRDIRRVFNAESLIIGFIAGTLGILVTYVFSYFANIIIYNKLGIANIAQLELGAAAVLILLSMFLAFVAGLIPSSAAAKKDPVEALRSE
jgi:putative ABC transport system permease protein